MRVIWNSRRRIIVFVVLLALLYMVYVAATTDAVDKLWGCINRCRVVRLQFDPTANTICESLCSRRALIRGW